MTAPGRSVGLLLAVLAAAGAVTACSEPETVPTVAVERRDFERRVTAEGLLQPRRATQITVPPEVQERVRLSWVAADGTLVEAGDVIARFDPTAMEAELDKGRSELEKAELDLETVEIQGEVEQEKIETERGLAELELDLSNRFQKTDDELFSRREIAESAIDRELARERKEHAESARERFGEQLRSTLGLRGVDRRRAQLTIDRARAGLEVLEVRAPHAGLLTLARDYQGDPPRIGTELWRGQEIAEIPDLSTMDAEVYVLEADAGGLEAGKPATVIVESHPGTVHQARIRRVETVAQPRFRGSPVQYFGVLLELAETDPEVMKPGQRVRATLLLERLEDVLVVPRQSLVEKGGETRVHLRTDGGFTPRAVEVGASSPGRVVITSGLEEGDEIALAPPGSGGTPEAGAGDSPEKNGAPPGGLR